MDPAQLREGQGPLWKPGHAPPPWASLPGFTTRTSHTSGGEEALKSVTRVCMHTHERACASTCMHTGRPDAGISPSCSGTRPQQLGPASFRPRPPCTRPPPVSPLCSGQTSRTKRPGSHLTAPETLQAGPQAPDSTGWRSGTAREAGTTSSPTPAPHSAGKEGWQGASWGPSGKCPAFLSGAALAPSCPPPPPCPPVSPLPPPAPCLGSLLPKH